LKYGAPDKGLFRVDQLKFYNGIVEGKPTYTENEGQFGEYWVCDGTKLQEFDRSKKECKIQQLPAELRGKEIFESPLPFVFNLNAAKIKERYWIKQIETEPRIVAIEAHPKFQNDRAQYKFVRIVISADTFLPQALILFGPNFDPQTSPAYDHYEFMDLERNTIGQSLAAFSGIFLNVNPPSDWRVIEDVYRPEPQPQIAQPGTGNTIR
jgi:TIGR03009 family protein